MRYLYANYLGLGENVVHRRETEILSFVNILLFVKIF